jgi:proteasome lid subunit RPN8/RPN11
MMIHFEWPLLYQMTADVENYSYERCGFLFGHEMDDDQIITRLLPVPNIRHTDKHISYEISSSAFLHAEEMAEQTATKLLGVYHSHPNHPAVPSEYDWVTAQPNLLYTIISVRNKKVCGLRFWQLNEFNLFEEKVYDFVASTGNPSALVKMSNRAPNNKSV